MKLTIPQPALASLIARGAAVATKKSALAILNTARLTADDGTLAIASTDQDRFAEARGLAEIAKPGAVCVDAAALATLIAKHPKGGVIGLELEGERLVVTCNRSKVRLPTLPVANFPAWADDPAEANFTIPAKEFERAIGRVRFAASDGNDKTKWALEGIYFDHHDGKLHLVATDGFSLAISGLGAITGAETCPKVIVPTEGIDAAKAMFKDAAVIDFAVSGKKISFAADGLRLASRLIDGTYPNYQRIIPAEGVPGLAFKRADFTDCLERAACLVGDGAFSSIVAVPDGDTLRLTARNHHGGEAVEELPAVIAAEFQTFGFNPRYGANFLAALNVDEISIEQGDPNGMHRITSPDAPDFVGVLAAVRV